MIAHRLISSTPARPRPGDPRTIREMLVSGAKRFGDHPALISRSGSTRNALSYSELAVAARDFAAGLFQLGLHGGDRVALIAENGVDWVVSWMGIALAGAVSVPIYGEHGVHEINNVVKLSGARFAVVGAQYAHKLEHRGLERVVVIDKGDESASRFPGLHGRFVERSARFSEVSAKAREEDIRLADTVDIRASDLLTVVYTSGTMGDPKGVMLSHRNMVSDLLAGTIIMPVSTRDRLLHVLPLHHCYPLVAGVLAALSGGATVYFENDLRRIRDRMGEIHPTIFFGVPALYAQIHRTILARLQSDGKLEVFLKAERISAEVKRRTGFNPGKIIFRELHEKFGGSIRFFGSGGAALPPDLYRRWALLGIPLLQGWGLSEASPVCSGQIYSSARFLFTKYYEKVAGTVGPALPGVDIACVDVPDKSIYAPIHGEGELLVRGPNVMQGYYDNETATREVLFDEWLRTGDIGRIDGQGNVYITGRAKSVIVLDSGEKVYPDELEERFEAGGVVGEVCVVGRRSGRLLGERKMQVCVVVYPDPTAVLTRAKEEGVRPSPDLIRSWVQSEVNQVQDGMASYKRINDVILTDAPLPKTDLRKVKRGLVKEHYSFDLEKLLTDAPTPVG